MGGNQPLPNPPRRNTRRYPRYSLDIRMNVSVFRSGHVDSLWGRSTELGQDGVGGTLTGALEPGEVVSMELPLPVSPSPVKLRAIVRYCKGLHYGFEFLTLTDDQRDTIRRTCDMLAASGLSNSSQF